jgi:aquaglyceroporin related protein, other eukaryote
MASPPPALRDDAQQHIDARKFAEQQFADMQTQPTQHVNGNSNEELVAQKTSQNVTGIRTALGMNPTAPIIEEHDFADHQDLWWSRVKLALREPLAEFFGVFILVLFGDGSVAQVLLSNKANSSAQTTAPGGQGFGAYQSISWGYCTPFYCLNFRADKYT